MTNGANYKRGKLHHSPRHRDIRTPNQLNKSQTKCVHIEPQSVGSGNQIPLENLSRRSTLPKFELSMFSAESKPPIVYTITMRHDEILSRWPR